jgi:hypothetical protein
MAYVGKGFNIDSGSQRQKKEYLYFMAEKLQTTDSLLRPRLEIAELPKVIESIIISYEIPSIIFCVEFYDPNPATHDERRCTIDLFHVNGNYSVQTSYIRICHELSRIEWEDGGNGQNGSLTYSDTFSALVNLIGYYDDREKSIGIYANQKDCGLIFKNIDCLWKLILPTKGFGHIGNKCIWLPHPNCERCQITEDELSSQTDSSDSNDSNDDDSDSAETSAKKQKIT